MANYFKIFYFSLNLFVITFLLYFVKSLIDLGIATPVTMGRLAEQVYGGFLAIVIRPLPMISAILLIVACMVIIMVAISLDGAVKQDLSRVIGDYLNRVTVREPQVLETDIPQARFITYYNLRSRTIRDPS